MGRLVGRTSGRLAWAALAFAASACSSGLELSVDLRTDYRPGVELDEVEVVWEDAQGAELGRRAVSAGPARDFVRGERLVDLAGLSPGRHRVRVTLLRRGVVVASRETLVRLSNDLAITVLVTRDCAEVRCPPAGAPARAACVDGRCVDPTCRPGRPDACPPPGCAVADDCPAPAVPCLRAA
ncbi:MAG TPA: hypothetical protein RMH99_05990, partial [Sandaracinaceae bacterium LLY-WYZ-13_1]|nr:hypothetical protein [Sandaracinaceae bacterium LLY-WYZ-13_1]